MILLYRHQLCFQTWFNNDFIWRISFVFIMPCLNSLWLPHLSMDLAGLSLGLYCCTMLVQSPHSQTYSEWFPSLHSQYDLYIAAWTCIIWADCLLSSQGIPQFSSVAQLCLTLCHPVDCSRSGFPVHHQLLELTETHVHAVGDAIQPSHPLSSPSPPTFNLSQHQGLFKWVSSSHQVAKVLEFQLPHQSFQWIFRTDYL